MKRPSPPALEQRFEAPPFLVRRMAGRRSAAGAFFGAAAAFFVVLAAEIVAFAGLSALAEWSRYLIVAGLVSCFLAVLTLSLEPESTGGGACINGALAAGCSTVVSIFAGSSLARLVLEALAWALLAAFAYFFALWFPEKEDR